MGNMLLKILLLLGALALVTLGAEDFYKVCIVLYYVIRVIPFIKMLLSLTSYSYLA